MPFRTSAVVRRIARTKSAIVASAAVVLASSCGGPHKTSVLVPIRVRVVDSAGAPVSDARVSLTRGLHQELASGATDPAGVLCFCSLFIFSPEYQVVVRKPGFTPARQFAKLEFIDSLKIDVVVKPVVAAADTIPASSPRRIDAEAIAASGRAPQNAFDVIRMLRPGMLAARANADACEQVSNLWVNGRRVLSPDRVPAPPRASPNPPRAPTPFDDVSVRVRSALNSIKPEHVAVIEYRDCHEVTEGQPALSNALFVSLKKGVQFEQELGSYVGAEPAPRVAAAESPAEEPNVTNVRGAKAVRLIEKLEAYRYRILGLFDGDTGAPIEGAEVRELATGTAAITSATGTVSLAFMRDGGGPVVLSKAGYKADIVTVAISPRDTTWLTFILFKAP